MTELWIVIAVIVYSAVAFIAFAMGQSRMRRIKDDETLNLLIEIRGINSKHPPLDGWLKDKINTIIEKMFGRKK